MYRQNQPKTFWGAVASGAPVEGFPTEAYQGRNIDYSIWVNNVYQQESYEAWENIGAAYTALKDEITAGNLSPLQPESNICDVPTNDTAALLFAYGDTIHGLATQYNTHFLRNNPIADPL